MKEVVWSLQRFDYVVTKWNIFHITFLKSVSRFLFCLDENIFTLTFGTMKKKIFYVCRNVEWFSQWYNSSATLFELFAEMLNDFHSDIILLQLVWIVCRDIDVTNILYFCNCHTLWLIVNKIRNLYINFSRMFARSNSLFNNMFTKLILNVVQSISCKWLINILVCGVQTS